jgi:hypothetical protein
MAGTQWIFLFIIAGLSASRIQQNNQIILTFHDISDYYIRAQPGFYHPR